MLQRRSARDLVREELRDRIVLGYLSPGHQPVLADLAAELGVSVTPVREALIDLERQGLVASQVGRGFRVRSFEAEEIEEIYPLIAALERLALRTAPPLSTAPAELRRINQGFRRERQPERLVELDGLWHATLLAACANRTLLELRVDLLARARRYELAFMADGGRTARSAGQHYLIGAALERGDLEAAGELLESNWLVSRDLLLPWVVQRGSRPRTAGRGQTRRR